MSAWPRFAPVAAFFLSLLGACSGNDSLTQPSSIPAPADSVPANPTPTPGFGATEGHVTDTDSGDPIPGARLDATSGSTSFSVTTNAIGAFRMDLPPGLARVVTTKEGYVTRTSEYTIPVGPTTLLISLTKVVVPPPAPTPTYTLSGIVIDVQGAPVAGATVYAYCCDSPIDGRISGFIFTDASARFRLTTTRFPANVRVQKTGYQRATATVARFPSGSTANMTIVVPRYVRYVPLPVSLKVGETVAMTARLELDNGASEVRGAMNLTSTNSAVIAALDGRYVKGIAPGTATITGSDEGLTGSVALTVQP
jgi:hypothetical protein